LREFVTPDPYQIPLRSTSASMDPRATPSVRLLRLWRQTVAHGYGGWTTPHVVQQRCHLSLLETGQGMLLSSRSTTRTTTVNTSATASTAAQHDEAELLLQEALECDDPARAEALRDEAVLLTLDLPEQVARRYSGRGIDHEDLVQVARLGLVKAAAGYKPGVGSCFTAYALPTISGEVKRYFRDYGWAVRPPRRLQEVRSLLTAQEERLTQSLQRVPTCDELADALGLDRDEVTRARLCGSAYSAVSLDSDDRDGHWLDAVADESADVDRMLSLNALRMALGMLTERERHIIRLRFVEERTQAEIGRVLGVSQMQVSRLLASILSRLREGLTDSARAA
jgi:RNA polymerase sigma-B factor